MDDVRGADHAAPSEGTGKDGGASREAVTQNIERSRQTRAHVERLRVALKDERLLPAPPRHRQRQGRQPSRPRNPARLMGHHCRHVHRHPGEIRLRLGLDRAMITQALAVKRPTSPNRWRAPADHVPQGRGIRISPRKPATAAARPERIVFEIVERDAIGDMGNMRRFLSDLRTGLRLRPGRLRQRLQLLPLPAGTATSST